jgi:hypothetical protein
VFVPCSVPQAAKSQAWSQRCCMYYIWLDRQLQSLLALRGTMWSGRIRGSVSRVCPT